MTIKKVIIEDGCISYGMCERICPAVVEMPDQAQVKAHADFSATPPI